MQTEIWSLLCAFDFSTLVTLTNLSPARFTPSQDFINALTAQMLPNDTTGDTLLT